MGKHEKLLAKFKSRPKDFTFRAATTLLAGFGYVLNQSGSGSRVRFEHEHCAPIFMHKTHPSPVLKALPDRPCAGYFETGGHTMKNTMDHQGYTGSVEYSDEGGIFFGKVQFVRALISYQGSNAKELRKDFHDGVDDYLALCNEKNITPEQPFKGSFNVRVGCGLHRQIAL